MHSISQRKCLCELCSCGEHTCFKHQNKYGSLNRGSVFINGENYIEDSQRYLSTYKDHYKPTRRLKTEPELQELYMGKQVPLASFPFQGSTTYKDSYCHKRLRSLNPEQSPKQMKDLDYLWKPVKFQGESSYKQDYRDNSEMQKVRLIRSHRNDKIKASQIFPNKGFFIEDTTYKSKYKPFTIKPTKQTRVQPLLFPPIKFEGISDYKDRFKPYSIRDELEPKCPIKYLKVPIRNYTGKRHIYYDDNTKTFS